MFPFLIKFFFSTKFEFEILFKRFELSINWINYMSDKLLILVWRMLTRILKMLVKKLK